MSIDSGALISVVLFCILQGSLIIAWAARVSLQLARLMKDFGEFKQKTEEQLDRIGNKEHELKNKVQEIAWNVEHKLGK